jgi:murein DD-endopeptidase MepM/ murein hydrolase activator NlpD
MQSYLSFLTATEQANEAVNYLVLVQLLKLADTPQQKMELERAVFDAEKAVYESRWQNAEAWISHFKSMEKLNPEQLVPLYQKLLNDAKTLGDQDKIWEYEEKLLQAQNDLADVRYTRAEKFISHYSAMDMLGPEELIPIYEQLLADAQKAGDDDKIWEYQEKLHRAQKELLEQEQKDMAKRLFERAAGLSGPAILGIAEYRAAQGKTGKDKETEKIKEPVDDLLKYLEDEAKKSSDTMKNSVGELTAYLRSETGDVTDTISANWQAAYAKAKIYADAIKDETLKRDALNKQVEFNNAVLVANIAKWGELSAKITTMTEKDLVDFQKKMENLFSFAMEYAPLPHSQAVATGKTGLIARVREIDNAILSQAEKNKATSQYRGLETMAGVEMVKALETLPWKKGLADEIAKSNRTLFGLPGGDAGSVPSGLPAGTYRMPVPGGRASDTWGASRDDGKRKHKGVDIFAPQGRPALSLANGTATPGWDRLGGRVVHLTGDDGSRFYYAHLSSSIGRSMRVRYGQWLGGVGKTGNAAGTSPHLHLQYRPPWASTWINPYPYLQRFKVVAQQPAGTRSTSQYVRHQGGMIGTDDTFRTLLQKGETIVPRSETPVLFGLLDKMDKLVSNERQSSDKSSNTFDLTINLEMPDGSVKTIRERRVGISDAELVISRKV